MKYTCCYGCYGYESDRGCLVGEKQEQIKNRFGYMSYAIRHHCKIKNKKEFVKRLEEEIERMTIK